jgi:hypothetical protein
LLDDVEDVPYVPTLSVRPAEMAALEELPENDKDLILPVILLRPWVSARNLSNALDKIEDVYGGDRPWIADIDPNYRLTESVREVHRQIDELLIPENGYENWCNFAKSLENIIPCLQLGDRNQLINQIEKLLDLPNGFAVRIGENRFPFIEGILESLEPYANLKPIIILDYGQEDYGQEKGDILEKAATAIERVNRIASVMTESVIVISATSFPSSFVGIADQEIFERRFFNTIKDNCEDVPLIYGDRGSARAERQSGGSGAPAPRVDYPSSSNWDFFRKEADSSNRLQKYREAAIDAMGSNNWDSELHIWGTQMIERTSLGDEFAIKSPATSTAARINIHLHIQTFYDGTAGDVHDTEDDWED